MDGEIFTIRARRCKRRGRLLTSAEAVEKGYGCQCAAKAQAEEDEKKPIEKEFKAMKKDLNAAGYNGSVGIRSRGQGAKSSYEISIHQIVESVNKHTNHYRYTKSH